MNALRRLRLEPLLSAKAAKPKPNDLEANSVVASPANAIQEEVEVIQPTTGTCPKCHTYFYPTHAYKRECHQCATAFCWACGKQVGDEDEAYILHLQWWNPFGCSSMDSLENVGNREWNETVLDWVLKIVVGPPALVFGVLVYIISLAFLPCVVFRNMPRKHAFLLTVNAVGLVFTPLILVVEMALVVFYPIVWSYRRCFPADD